MFNLNIEEIYCEDFFKDWLPTLLVGLVVSGGAISTPVDFFGPSVVDFKIEARRLISTRTR